MRNKKVQLKNKKPRVYQLFIHIAKLITGILVGYVLLFIFSNIFFRYILSPQEVRELTLQNAFQILPQFLLSIGLSFGIGIYLFNSWLAKKWLHIQWSKAFLFMGTIGALAPIGEIFVSKLSVLLLGHPLWVYKILPVHDGNTSMVMALFWPIYGFHVYCLHAALKAHYHLTEDSELSLFVGIDAMVIEVLVNLFSLFFFYTYIFYYLAGDLWHLSTATIFLPYIIFGFVVVKILHKLEKRHHHIIVGSIGFAVSLLTIFVI